MKKKIHHTATALKQKERKLGLKPEEIQIGLNCGLEDRTCKDQKDLEDVKMKLRDLFVEFKVNNEPKRRKTLSSK